ncbi:exodeoxyribonuclease v subunit beta [Lasius niger]|uniref:Exodeoxyribonuclease v subunit beta n=1 Tax=Lasius niger TaxID=67767 RepID=A0A0J7N0T4_LASNI|nr:exodeoxyribonuclease v subunit beta [Lasius niger]
MMFQQLSQGHSSRSTIRWVDPPWDMPPFFIPVKSLDLRDTVRHEGRSLCLVSTNPAQRDRGVRPEEYRQRLQAQGSTHMFRQLGEQ